MLNFRDELTRIEEGRGIKLTVEECAENFLKELLCAFKESARKYNKQLIFYLDRNKIEVKLDKHNVTYLYVYHNNSASEIFNFVRNKFKSESFEFEDDIKEMFTIIVK